MSSSRRDFLSLLAAGGAAPFLPALRLAAAQLPQSSPQSLADPKTMQFWQEHLVAAHPGGRPQVTTAKDDNRHPEFAAFDKDNGFRIATQIRDTQLLDRGDVAVSLRVLAFKPAAEDLAEFANIQTGSLRVDFQQTRAQSGHDPLVWTAFAGVQPDAKGKLPGLQNTSFNPGTTWGQQQDILLPGGAGLWGWNFFVQKKESLWCQVVAHLASTADKVVPLFGFPALAISGVAGFNQLFGFLVAQSHKSKFLFQTFSDPAVATKDARQDAQYADGLPIASGVHYIIVPRKHLQAFGEQMGKHEVMSGVVVPSGTKPHEVFEAARDAMKDVTYLSLAVSVKSAG